jgi:ribosomal-protein-alanine N-acetyltransferase
MLDLTAVFATFPVLESERCLLRASTDEDTPDIFRIMGDARVTRYLGRAPMQTMDEAVQRVAGYRATFKAQEGIPWVVTSRADGQVMGTAVYWHLVKEHFRAEIGYILAPEWWGQGIMTEVASEMLKFGFMRMGLNSVEAQLDPENRGSRRLLEKLGFVEEGYFRENFYDPEKHEFGDTAVYSLLKSTWLSRKDG